METEWNGGKYVFTGRYYKSIETSVSHTYVLLSDCYHVKTFYSHIYHASTHKNEQPIDVRLKWLTIDGSFHNFKCEKNCVFLLLLLRLVL